MTLGAYQQQDNNQLFEKISPKKSGIKFKNALRETDSENMLSFMNFYTGAGVGVIDVNNDGLQDLFFAGNQVTSRLYLNKGGFKFEDITVKSGIKTDRWITGVSIVDINQDGFDDIYLSVSGVINTANMLFVNNGNSTFSEQSASYNLNIKEQITQTSFFDYDHDGDLDAFLATNPTDFEINSTEPLQKPKINGESRGTDILLRNDGNGKFTDVSRRAGILTEGYSLGLNTSDFNHDGWTDIYISNDYISNDILYINNGDGTFTNKVKEFFDYTSFASMGIDAGDINNDGLLDIITLDMLPESSSRQKVIVGTPNYDGFMSTIMLGYLPSYSRNMLQLNNGNNTFSEIGRLAGIFKTDWSWAPILADLDNDGYKDLFITTGFRRDMGNLDFIYKTEDSPFRRGGDPVPVPVMLEAIKRTEGVPVMNYAFKNNGDLSFSNKSIEWGFDEKSYSTGLATADLDNDGDLDLIINNVDDYASIYENKTEKINNHFIKIRLEGPSNNRSATGSKILIYFEGNLQYMEYNTCRGYMSSVDKNILFGMGSHTGIDSLIVVWPDGSHGTWYNISVNKIFTAKYNKASTHNFYRPSGFNQPMKYKETTSEFGIAYRHYEDIFIDFHIQPSLPYMISHMGPSVAVGDINNDGLEDFFVGGSRGYPATLFFQTAKRTFRSQVFPFDKEFEDTGALLFDFDGDSDLDLYVVSGGTFAGKASKLYQDRLYLNIGYGRFKKTENLLPVEQSSGSVVTAADFDRDGDLDLFVGGRVSPTNYPVSPGSILLENRTGRFIDVTNEKASGLSAVGMVTSALWTDYDEDGDLDLLIVGEWMPVTLYQNNKGFFSNRTSEYGLDHTEGMWNSINSGHFNEDERIDYILGNIGLNNPYFASASEPLKLVSKDYNNDGVQDPLIIMKYTDGYYPIASRSQFLTLFPQKANKYATYQAYAKTVAADLLNDLGPNQQLELQASMFASAILLNGGNGSPVIKSLPNKAQFSPIYGTLCYDLNSDNKTEILCAGNFYQANVTDGPYSASTGTYISVNGSNKIEISSGCECGFNVHKDSRAIASIVLGNQKRIFIVTNNNDSLKIFSPVVQQEQHIRLQTADAYAIIEWNNGLIRKREFYYGSGYLSQSSRYLSLSPGWKKVKIVTYSGKERYITPDDLIKIK